MSQNMIINKIVIHPIEILNYKFVDAIAYAKNLIVCIFGLLVITISAFAWSIEVTQGPSITMNPNNRTPLAGVVEFTTDVPVRATLSVSNGIDGWVREFAEYQIDHYIPVLGLKPNNTYEIEVTVTDETDDSIVLSPLLEAVTDPLPANFPNISVLQSDPARMEPGYTLLDRFARFLPNTTPSETPDGTLPRYSMILDNMGEVVWYSPMGTRGMKQLQNGNLLLAGQDITEMSLLGYVRRRVNLDHTRQLHHDTLITDEGTILSLSTMPLQVDNYPSSETDPNAPPQSATIIDSPVVEFSPDGTLINLWPLSDILDTTRIGYNALNMLGTGFDWVHANAVLHDPSDDSIIVSLRQQDAVVKFSRATGALTWILGNHNNWSDDYQPYLLRPIGAPFEWQYHQHAPMVTPSGNILLFDNGNNRASPFDGTVPQSYNASYSRAVEYAIDEDNMEVTQIWESVNPAHQRYFCPTVGDADWMNHTGNVLITYGNTMYIAGQGSDAIGMGFTHTRVVEMDHDTPPNKVFEVAIYNTTPGSRVHVYRSERIPDLYPVDTDADGVPDYQDNCVHYPNGPLIKDAGGNSQLDTDNDGFGNLCDGDLNNDGQTNSLDLGLLRLAFFSNESQTGFNPNADLNGDGAVNSLDLGVFKALFFQAPGSTMSTPN